MTNFCKFLVVFLTFSNFAFSQNFLSTSGKSIINEKGDTIILRGMGLGGWMSGEIFDLTQSYKLAFVNGIFWNFTNLLIVTFIMWKVYFQKDRFIYS